MSSDATVRNKRQTEVYRIKKISKSPHKQSDHGDFSLATQTATSFMLKCKPTQIQDKQLMQIPSPKQVDASLVSSFSSKRRQPTYKDPTSEIKLPDINDSPFSKRLQAQVIIDSLSRENIIINVQQSQLVLRTTAQSFTTNEGQKQ